ncbi:MAG: hypothetical protein U1D30_15005 [Planctomycetota bacterium]
MRWLARIAVLPLIVGALAARAQDASSSLNNAANSISSAQSSPAATQATTLWSLIAQIPAACAACKAKFCASCCGQLVNNMLMPLTMLSGGCIKCCPDLPNNNQLNQAGAAGACAQIEKDTIEAKQRVEAVQCLASVDCRYWPEAEQQLIASLRADKNECVRLAAAIVLGKGCCCTKNTIQALTMTVEGSDKDGNPPESSRRVRSAAATALQHCLACYQGPLAEPNRPETPVPPETPAPANPVPPAPATPAPSNPPASELTPTTTRPATLPSSITSVTVAKPVEVMNGPSTMPGGTPGANAAGSGFSVGSVGFGSTADASVDPTLQQAREALARVPMATPRAAKVKTGERSLVGIFRAAKPQRPSGASVPNVPATPPQAMISLATPPKSVANVKKPSLLRSAGTRIKGIFRN